MDTPQEKQLQERQLELLKIASYDAWVRIQVASQTIEESRATMMQNAKIIAELEQTLKG
jgi:hypothetical protein